EVDHRCLVDRGDGHRDAAGLAGLRPGASGAEHTAPGRIAAVVDAV
ncbi:MAG: hypothetical protein AVDCRST_MAG17-1137, partial [uncultured Solirubrobacterales bacterium]